VEQGGAAQRSSRPQQVPPPEGCRHRLITLGAENSFSDLYNQ